MSLAPEVQKKIKNIKGIAFDCDGVMTNGQIFYNGDSGWCRFFNIKDGMGIKRLQKAGIHVAIITNSDTVDIKERAKTLGIEDLFDGVKDKVACFEELQSRWQLGADQIAYMGDDFQDVPVLELAGLSAAPPNALPEVKSKVDIVTSDYGGFGAVREVCELILR